MDSVVDVLIRRIRNTPADELIIFVSMVLTVVFLIWYLLRPPAPQGLPQGINTPNVALLASSPTPATPATSTSEQILPPPPTSLPTLPPLQLPEVTPPPGGQVIVVTPAADAVGWVRQGDKTPNHFGDYNIYAGTFEGQVYIGLIQFDLTEVPAGAPITYADLTLVGLADQYLVSEGSWHVELLEPWMEADWEKKDFAGFQRPDGATLELTPPLRVGDLGVGRPNTLVFGPEALEALSARIYSGRASFRIRGPDGGPDNLFSWDSGYGTGSRGQEPVLRIVAGPAPETPPPPPTPHYVIITSVPPTQTPANVVTLAAQLKTATAEATPYLGTGTPMPLPTATSLPPDWVTPVVIVPTATPANSATAQWHAAVATAQAFAYGTPTSLPPNVWTATPKPTYIVVTNTPAPANIVTVAAVAGRATQEAARFGTPTPGPPMVGLLVVTNTPTPGNTATAAWVKQVATAEAFVYGTPTPLPTWAVTATPVPLLVFEFVTATPTPTPTGPAPAPTIPSELRGQILFLSDRLGHEKPDVLVYDPATGRIALLTQLWAYDRAQALEPLSPDGGQRVIVRSYDNDSQLWLENTTDGWQTYLTGELGGADYEPAWQPGGPLIAYVAQQDRNDEIYVFNKDTQKKRRLTINTWEWDKHPTWSPDGKQIVFWSNRQTGRKQIWIMNADGSDQRLLFQDDWNNWDPVWVK